MTDPTILTEAQVVATAIAFYLIGFVLGAWSR